MVQNLLTSLKESEKELLFRNTGLLHVNRLLVKLCLIHVPNDLYKQRYDESVPKQRKSTNV